MKRRRLLQRGGALVAGLATAGAGCLQGDGVTGASVEHAEPRRLRGTRPTVVGFDEGAGVVRITGFIYYGSSSCNRVGLEEVDYDASARTLRVVVGSVDDQFLPMGCTADMAATWYRATVEFGGDLPETVTVVESGTGRESTTRTVDRSEQRERCLTEHPEGSNASRRAHWTCPERYVAADDSTGVRTPDDRE